MSAHTPSEPAYPNIERRGPKGELIESSSPGLSKVELLAGMAMQGLLAADVNFQISTENIAKSAITQAQMLIAELDKQS